MKTINKPWGYEKVWAQTDNYIGKQILIKEGERLSLQYHEEKEESIFVQYGVVGLEVDGDKPNKQLFKLYPGDSYHIPPGTVHRMIAIKGESGFAAVIEVSTTQLNDVIRLEDDYGRAGVREYNDEFALDDETTIPNNKKPSKPPSKS